MLGKGTAWIEDLSLQELLVRFDKCLDIECTGGMHGYIHGEGGVESSPYIHLEDVEIEMFH